MNGVMNKTQFAMKSYRDKITAEKKQNQLKKKMLKKNGTKNEKKQSNRKRIEKYIGQHEINKKK